MKVLTVQEAKTTLPQLIEQALAGEESSSREATRLWSASRR
jgi:hypothetical protein